MNRSLFVVLLFIVISEAACGQFKLGVKAGMNLSNGNFTETSTEDLKVLTSINGGVFSEVDFNEQLSLRAELLYSVKGWKGLNQNAAGDEFKLNLHYLNLPILIGYKPISKLSLLAGPEFGYLIHAARKPASSIIDPDDLYRKFDLGLCLGSSYSLTKNFSIEMRYTYGFAPLVKETVVLRDANNNPIGESTFKDGANRVFQFNLLYTLWHE